MVQFGSGGGYFSAMDRGHNARHDSSPDRQAPALPNPTQDVNVGIKDLGFSLGLGPVPGVQALGAKMRSGVKHLEVTFMGSGKGNQQGHSPGTYGKVQRQALREMQAANDYHFTTHASVGVMGLAGMDRQGNFSKEQRDNSLNEIRRAIDFAAEVTQGGPVVVHSGEFMRHMADAKWNINDPKWKNRFQMYEGEEEETTFRVVDRRTGSHFEQARKNRRVATPEWNRYQKGDPVWDEQGGKEYYDSAGNLVKPGDYIDYFGRKLDRSERVPKYDYSDGKFKVKLREWDYFENEAKKMTQEARSLWKQYKEDPNNPKWKDSIWTRFKDAKSIEEVEVLPEEAYVISTFETQASTARGWARYYGGAIENSRDQIKKYREALNYYEKIESVQDEEKKKLLLQTLPDRLQGLVPPDQKYPTQLLRESLRQLESDIKQKQEASTSQWAQAANQEELMRNVESAEKYALKQAYDAYAKAGLKAMVESDRAKKERGVKKPIGIAVENLFPNSYGGHADELIDLIQNSRKKMVVQLTQQGMREQEAQKKAKDHIYATFDTAHFNMWWKYWKGDQSKTMEDNRKEFDKWYLEQVEKLAKAGVVGHLHLVDNYGYEDEHLAPGQGNTPIKKAVKIFQKHGYKGKMVVEPGADFYTDTNGTNTLLKAWRHFGTPVYGVTGSLGTRPWSQVQYGFFGHNQPPYFSFGSYVPSEDWTLWSGVQLE